MKRMGRPRSFDQNKVLDAAKDAFWSRGYSATSMRSLSIETGILPGSIHAAFGSKRELFVLSLQQFSDTSGTELDSVSLSDDPVKSLRGILESVVQSAKESPGRGCMLGNTAVELLPHDEEVRTIVSSGFRSFELRIERSLLAAQQAGQIRKDIDCRSHGRLLLALVQGLHVMARSESQPDDLSDIIETALDTLKGRQDHS